MNTERPILHVAQIIPSHIIKKKKILKLNIFVILGKSASDPGNGANPAAAKTISPCCQ